MGGVTEDMLKDGSAMTNQHPITPPPELVEQWCNNPRLTWLERLSLAYAAGADQELEACCEYIAMKGKWFADSHFRLKELRAARRPKPPSLKEQALELARPAGTEGAHVTFGPEELELIRRALEVLPE
jgi:hypothetical protein